MYNSWSWGCIASTRMHFKKQQADNDSDVVKSDQNLNARNSVSALRAERDLILAELFGVRPSLRLAIA